MRMVTQSEWQRSDEWNMRMLMRSEWNMRMLMRSDE